MFTKIKLSNYRTHKSSTIELGPVTLLIGNNNSGKTNFLSALRHFCHLIRRARLYGDRNITGTSPMVVDNRDLFFHRHKLAEFNDSISISVSWEYKEDKIEYYMELFPSDKFEQRVGCKEKIEISTKDEGVKTVTNGYEESNITNKLGLRKKIETESDISDYDKTVCNYFFGDFASIYAYHLQPSFIKGQGNSKRHEDLNVRKIASQLGYEGGNFQDIILLIKKEEDRLFQKFIASLRRFESSFHGIDYNEKTNHFFWQFDMKGSLQGFPPNAVSDGLVKAGVISLLTSLPAPPALILLEEIENGINPGNIQEFIRWIWQATSSDNRNRGTQFVLTSHSPSVLREFHHHIDHVYTVRLDKHTFSSDVRNLNSALDSLVGIGAVEGRIFEKDNKRLVEIPRYDLTELWYSGTIG